MVDFVEYVVSELKSRRLSRGDALSLIRQFSANRQAANRQAGLHPLLQRNISDLDCQRYGSSFSGDEFFLRDHQVAPAGATVLSVLPGVAYLEMARAAVLDALPHAPRDAQVVLSDVVWLKPLVVNGPRDVFIALYALDDAPAGAEAVEFEIFTVDAQGDAQADELVHCRGRAALAAAQAPQGTSPHTLAARMGADALDAQAVYAAYQRMGMRFGPAHQAVQRVQRGDQEVLARLSLPAAADGALEDFPLHPSLMDGALQACIGLLGGVGGLSELPSQPSLPFALDSLRVHAPCTRQMLAWIRPSQGTGLDGKTAVLDIDVMDEQGRVCVELRGFASRPLAPAAAAQAPKASEPEMGVVMARPVWQLRALPQPGAAGATLQTRHHVVLCGWPDGLVRALEPLLPQARVHVVPAPREGLADQYTEAALACFELVKALPREAAWVQLVVPDEAASRLLLGLGGLLKSAAQERPGLAGQTVLAAGTAAPAQLAAALQAELAGPGDAAVRLAGAAREVLAWQAPEDAPPAPGTAYRHAGVYLVTGGLGGLGRLFAQDMLRQAARATVILTGRAAASPDIGQQLRAVDADAAAAGRLRYRALDVTDAAAVQQCVAEIRAAHGRLDGIVHGAGMLADALLAHKTVEEFAQVLAPKVRGAVHLDAATRELDLDFLALFSSGAAVSGNAGQSDYAAANGFLDQFAHYRNALVAAGQRRGRTLSINWPLWQDGGMRMPAHALQAMRESVGMVPMGTANGLQALQRGLRADASQLLVIEGEAEKIRRAVFETPAAPAQAEAPAPVPAPSAPAAAASAAPQAATAGLRERTRDFLRGQFATLFKMPAHKVDPAAALEKYGIDSILAMDLTRQLEKSFGPLPKTLFFEHQTIDELTGYFLDTHAPRLQALFEAHAPQAAPAPAAAQATVAPAPAAAATARPAGKRPSRRRQAAEAAAPGTAASHEPIAIVGLSGRYPESPDIEAFWANLRDGRDCIVEVPRGRWDWRDYYSEDRTAPGRHYSKWGGFIEGVDEFDPLFFNIPPVDAGLLDPQERLFLQHAWMAMEDAGYTRAALQAPLPQGAGGQVGVYVGVMYGEYQLLGAEASLQGRRMGIPVSYASIANRVSYVLNAHGPSMTLDTMCSSSLTAIHLACQDLKLGRTHLALAGGVNVTIHPNKYLILSAGQFISGDGHCQSFGEGGDGYIPGEGVGVVVLKRLSEAERDGNHVYGVIKGSALNHGGKTNGYSVPNPKAQARVIEQALKEYGTDARHISYIEAHGTGTRLGDPIEIAALSQVFRQYSAERGFCAIGSAKSNIGHCESAAGIAGLTKVLLQMKHRLIVPSLHSAVLNPHIDFESSPFVVNQALRDWEQPLVEGRRVPRIAGISSFGAGGSNAHLIVQEYGAQAEAGAGEPDSPVIVPLSARTGEQLQRKAAELLAFIERQEQAPSLHALAFTLQAGREAMDHRLACVAGSARELAQQLRAWGQGQADAQACFQGRVEKDHDGLAALAQDEDMQQAIATWIARGKLAKLADLWVRGLALDWRQLQAGRRPALMSLPTYPFARDRYWVDVAAGRGMPGANAAANAAATSAAATAVLHPLLHANTSDFFQQSYAAEFSGQEFFLADHQVLAEGQPRKLLPGVAYLEMVRAAVEAALAEGGPGQALTLRNVVWAQPLVVQQPRSVSVALSTDDGQSVDFEVRSLDGAQQAPVVHCQGQAVLDAAAPAPALDLSALRARMTRDSLDPAALYERFEAMGLRYGASMRCITALHRGQGQLLAELALPHAQDARLVLHPALLDSALQSAIGLALDADGAPSDPPLPFALDALAVHAPCAPRLWAWVREAADGGGEGLVRIDLDLCDAEGRVCASLRGLSSRRLRSGADEGVGLLLATPAWEAAPAAAAGHAAPRRHVLLCGLPLLDAQRLQALLPGSAVAPLALPDTAGLAERYRDAALACLEQLQALLGQAPQEDVLFQAVVADAGKHGVLAGLAGLLATARLENPRLLGQVVCVAGHPDEAALARQLQAAGAQSGESLVHAEGTALRVLRWREEAAQGTQGAQGVPAFRDGGVYLVTGGLGGLGLVFARAILRQARDAVVVLTGRAAPGAAQQEALARLAEELSLPPGRLAYRQLDPARIEQAEAVVAEVAAHFGTLTGVLHSAGMIDDGLLLHKTAARFAAVLAPKVQGTVNLDLATRHLALDFLVLFSSVTAALGNPGQGDYAAANGFMDAFAAHRNALVAAGQRQGRTLSVLWPLWREGGMQLDPAALQALTRASGMVPLDTDAGVQALQRGLALAPASRLLVAQGHLARLRQALQRRQVPRAAAPAAAPLAAPLAAATAPAAISSPATDEAATLLDKAQRYLVEQFCGLLHIPPHEVDAKAPLEQYGMDSVLAMKLTNQLEASFGSLSKTLFFEYQTIAALAAYLVRAFPSLVREKTGMGESAAAPAAPVPAAMPALAAPVPARRTARPLAGKLRPASAAAVHPVDDIAIVGLAGRYPQAPDLQGFWRNLREGRDCITEIPAERWDHAPFFTPARNQPGKAYSKWGGFLDGADRFDALFFSISPKEAELMDPQERLFIETAWEALEDAGYAKDALARARVGVYVGAMWGQYELYGMAAPAAGVPSSSFASIANRVSYFFDFHGPSLALDTMCSSSLTALHLACEALRNGSIDVALAGGVNLSLHPSKYLSLSQGNFVSTDGRCRSFGEGGDGYVPGEGVGAVLLKPLAQAVADGDHVHGVIKASTINHGGKTNGYTVPNPVAQAALIRQALEQARVAPHTIGYVETHGTGTSLGDPIEITGLVRAFEETAGPAGTPRPACAIGSVKSNIGHLESAAGMAALTKVLLQMRHRLLVPSLHAQRLNPHIDFEATPFRVQRTLQDWPRPAGHPRRAAISSFGAGGSNAHLIVEDYEAPATAAVPATPALPQAFVLSARNREALLASARRMVDFLEQAEAEGAAPALADMAYTSQLGRTPMQERLAVVATDAATLQDRLQRWLAEASAARRAAAIEGVHEGSTRDAASGTRALFEGEGGRAFLQHTLQQRDVARLAQVWVLGVEIDWAALHQGPRPRRVPLPTYPFARERYWIAAAPVAPATPVAAAARTAPRQALYCQSEWTPAPLREGDAPAGVLLCLGGAAGLAPALTRLGGTVVTVQWSEGFQRLDADRYGVNPGTEADFAALLQALRADGRLPRAVVQALDACDDTQRLLDQGVLALHGLCKAWLQQLPGEGLRLVALRDEAAGTPAALQRALGGYFKSLALENPRLGWKLLPLDGAAGAEGTARRVWAELGEQAWTDGELRYAAGAGDSAAGGAAGARRERLAVARMAPQALAAAQQALARQRRIRQRGVYIVTGGLGGLGGLLGRYLASHYGARLVLTGRSALDGALQARLDALAAAGAHLGAEAVYVQADVADAAQAETVVAAARQRFGRIDGVIHSAGVHRDAYALRKNREDLLAVLSAKVAGTLHLDRLTRDEPLDLFVLFSSVAGTLGNAGQCDYAFANAFLDAFAEQRQAQVAAGERQGRSLSIAWPLWEEGGMRIADSDVALLEQRSGAVPLPTAAGLECWETLLHTDTPRAMALYGDAARMQALLAAAGAAQHAAAPAAQAQGQLQAASPDGGEPALRQAAEDYLKGLLSEEIKLPVDRIDAQEPFESFGVDSMMVNRINTRLEQDLGELPKTLFYQYATVEELAGYLLQSFHAALQRHLGAPAAAAPAAPAERDEAAFAAPAPAPVADVPQAPALAARPAHGGADAADAGAPMAADEPIAIIGLHAQLPGSPSLEAFWDNLREGRDLVTLVPPQRWRHEDYQGGADGQGAIYCKWGGFLDDVDRFDAAFFGISADDARLMDPQERLFLQSVWATVEDAGYTRDSLRRHHPKERGRGADVGVFVGVTTNSYQMLGPDEWRRGNLVTPGSLPWSIANRVSYTFDFQGPSLPVDTACSSALVAIHLACESLRRAQCQVAVAGAVNLYLHPSKYQSLCRRHMLAEEGKCRSFGHGDDGFVPSEAIGSLLLKPLRRALADGDHVYGVVAASACEHAGRANGYSAPNPNSQALLIGQMLDRAGIHPHSIGYVEGHGTGTQLGDSLEVASLTQAFARWSEQRQFCALGSVKANLGHGESAAGIAGVAKVLLQLRHGQIAPSLYGDPPNPNIDFAATPLRLQRELGPWAAPDGQARRALVNSFGAGGVNACLVLEEAPAAARAAATDAAAGAGRPCLVLLSARNEERLQAMAQRLREHVAAQPGAIELPALAYTLQVGREALEQRLALRVASTAELLQGLAAHAAGQPRDGLLLGRVEAHRRKKLRPRDREALQALFDQGELDALAQRWVSGQDVPWEELHGSARGHRVALPTYPFAGERYWVTDMPAAAPAAIGAPASSAAGPVAAAAPAQLHPLVGANVSTLRETAFASVLSAGAYYGRDHRVHGQSIFPGAGYLEMACVAGAIAGEAAVARLEDIVWTQPLRLAAEGQRVLTVLRPNGLGVEFAVVSFDEDNERVVHAEGQVLPQGAGGAPAPAEAALDLQALRGGAVRSLAGADCYRQFQAFGFDYGASFQPIQELYVGQGYALSRLALAPACEEDFEQYILHPALLDGALQTVVGLATGEAAAGAPNTPFLPFALGAVQLLRPLTAQCWAHVEPTAANPAQADVRQFNIRLLSEGGEVLVKLSNFYVRALRAPQQRPHSGVGPQVLPA